MKELFLKAKHWQLFILMMGIPLVFQFYVMQEVFGNILTQGNPNPETMIGMLKYLPVIMFIFMGLFFGWLWSLAMGLQNKIPEEVKMKTTKFKIFFFIPVAYLIIILTLVSVVIIAAFKGHIEPNSETILSFVGIALAIIVPMHLFSVFCIFYSLYFAAKTIKTVELQKEVKFSDFVGEFFLLWFYYIGLWIIQPKVNKMMKKSID
ncbi:hypothetical protein [Labilibacter marinus]|uniref:hypothetical protein n=1 Tax=Labilibacter marinus TaxID=1477105 RepID=UPI00094F7424|nr:hypothetical protein [Labilibacter marinus]